MDVILLLAAAEGDCPKMEEVRSPAVVQVVVAQPSAAACICPRPAGARRLPRARRTTTCWPDARVAMQVLAAGANPAVKDLNGHTPMARPLPLRNGVRRLSRVCHAGLGRQEQRGAES